MSPYRSETVVWIKFVCFSTKADFQAEPYVFETNKSDFVHLKQLHESETKAILKELQAMVKKTLKSKFYITQNYFG